MEMNEWPLQFKNRAEENRRKVRHITPVSHQQQGGHIHCKTSLSCTLKSLACFILLTEMPTMTSSS